MELTEKELLKTRLDNISYTAFITVDMVISTLIEELTKEDLIIVIKYLVDSLVSKE